ncbi:MAG: hypothetical protein A2Z51_00245 [Deltaproteobacteria bacterium RBG_19FT_COMBO_52_11]|nr:MAG: hypothetical protein A2Z51_00245 [Deltaproteobacteria bacterium RBG_19FT_COMBO_52_11]
MGFLEIVGSLWMGSRPKAQDPFQQTLDLVKRDPENPEVILNLLNFIKKTGSKKAGIFENLPKTKKK